MKNKWLEEITEELKKLPGIGEKSAFKITLHILSRPQEEVEEFARKLVDIKRNLKFCSICGGLTVEDPCEICSDPYRDRSILMVVEKPQDIFVFEKTGVFKGKYHVLGGLISPSAGITPDKLRIKELKERVVKEGVKELIISTSPTVEGETTALYIKKLFENTPVKISRLASGIPFGADLEFTDERTLSRALLNRITLE